MVVNCLVDVCGSHTEGYHVSSLTPVAMPSWIHNQSRLNIPRVVGILMQSSLSCLPDLLVSQEEKYV